MKLGEIAAFLHCPIIGDPGIEILGIATIEDAKPTQLTFISNIKYRRYLATTKAAAIIVDDPAFIPTGVSAIISPHPYLTFAQALALFSTPLCPPSGIHPQAVISPSAQLSEG